MFPIRDHNPSGRTPYVTIALIAINILVFLGYFLPHAGAGGIKAWASRICLLSRGRSRASRLATKSARRRASSLTTLFMPNACAASASPAPCVLIHPSGEYAKIKKLSASQGSACDLGGGDCRV